MEIFKNITDFDRYAVSNIGRVINNKTGRILKPNLDGGGYFLIRLSKDGKVKTISVHRLVAMEFIENIDNKLCVDHINNIRTDNRLENLRWATNIENGRNANLSSKNKSGVKGIYFKKAINKWCAQIKIDGKHKHIGCYSNIEDAKKARQKKALEFFGEFMNECEK